MAQVLKKECPFQIESEFLKNYHSQHTRRAYINDINQFFDYINHFYPQIQSLSEVQRQHIIEYRNHLQNYAGKDGGPLAPKSVARKMASLDSYFDFIIEHKSTLEVNPTSSVKRPKQEVVTPTQYVSREKVFEMIELTKTSKESGRLHQALLTTYFFTGLRTSEILSLRIKDMISLNGQQYFQVMGKGGKIHHKQLLPVVVQAIGQYLDWLNELGRSVLPHDWLFRPTKNPYNPMDIDHPLTAVSVNEIFEKYARMAAVPGHISAHSARATFITDYLTHGGDLKEVANEVGHASTTTTEIYDKRRKKLQINLSEKLGLTNKEK